MTKMEKPTILSRRAVLMGAGALVVSVGAPLSFDTLLGMSAAAPARSRSGSAAGYRSLCTDTPSRNTTI